MGYSLVSCVFFAALTCGSWLFAAAAPSPRQLRPRLTDPETWAERLTSYYENVTLSHPHHHHHHQHGQHSNGTASPSQPLSLRFEEHITSNADLIVAIDNRRPRTLRCSVVWINHAWTDIANANHGVQSMTKELYRVIVKHHELSWTLQSGDLATYFHDALGESECVGHHISLVNYKPSFTTPTTTTSATSSTTNQH